MGYGMQEFAERETRPLPPASQKSEAVRYGLRTRGEALEPSVRTAMETRFGVDFSRIRVHTDAAASESAQAMSARAYTFGHHIAFARGQYAVGTAAGRRLLAHELAHAVQQSRGTGRQAPGALADPGPEHGAEAAAREAELPGGATVEVAGAYSPGVMRQPAANNPLLLPAEVVEMPWVGKGEGTTSSQLGYLRDSQLFWQRWRDHYGTGGALSRSNLDAIAHGRSPVVDDVWVSRYPEHAAYKGQVLEHHHVGQGALATPVPHDLHAAHSVLHPKRQTVGAPNRPVKAMKPQPDRPTTEADVARHTASGKIRGEGVTPTAPPKVGPIPPSSPAAVAPTAGQPKVELPQALKQATESGATAGVEALPRSEPVIPLRAPRGMASGVRGGGLTQAVEGFAGRMMAVASVVDVILMYRKGAWETPVGTWIIDERKYFKHLMLKYYGLDVDQLEGKIIEENGEKFIIIDGLPQEWDEVNKRARPLRPRSPAVDPDKMA
ncbi:DUF4157 domain-containing protein [Streptomyces afghaniensis]|uniref:eCIS core domain-containing protein n=1 Tax=Streptomyces afghaniensis TaxID=66865 RepID=UPI0037D53361